MSTFHPKKCCAIFLSLKNIPLTLHTDFIIFIIFVIPSTVCLMSGPTPSFGGGWRQISGFEWPDCARQQQSLNRVWVITVLGSPFNKKTPNPTFLGKNDQWVQEANQSLPPAVLPPRGDVAWCDNISALTSLWHLCFGPPGWSPRTVAFPLPLTAGYERWKGKLK